MRAGRRRLSSCLTDMTPFDPVALLAMLQAFYPVVGPAALARARAERPDYFSAGAIIGTSGDKIRLPDGRIFDLIFDTNGPHTRWQALDVGTGTGGPDVEDPFALEAGPLVPVDLSAWSFSTPGPVFESLVAGHLAQVGPLAGGLDGSLETLTLASSPRGLENAFGATIGAAVEQLAAEGYALDGIAPFDVVAAVAAAGPAIDAEAGSFDEPPPAEVTPDPAPPFPGPDPRPEPVP